MSTATITEHKKFVCVEFGNTNNNKVWQYTIYDDGTALTEWGRIGQGLQSKVTSPAAALKKMREKTNPNNKPDKRYTEVKAVNTGGSTSVSSVKNAALKDVAQKQIKSNNPIVYDLVEYLVKVNAHQIMKQSGGKINYDPSTAQFKTPLGVIDPSQVAEARKILVNISDFVSNQDFNNSQFASALNDYLRLIPHDVGMSKISPQKIFPNTQTVIAENDLLDGLETSFIDVTKTEVKENGKTEPKVFDVDMSLLSDSKEIDRISSYYEKTKKTMHQAYKYSVKRIYTISIKESISNFEKTGKKIGNIFELFHGTKSSNLLSILRQGLIIPSANASHCTGRMFGNGAYGSDVSSKALNYATNFWGSGGNTDRIFMFLCDFAMGNIFYPKGSSYNYPVKGYDSTFAKSGVSGVINNEMIVYNVGQVNLKYLIEFN